MGGFLKARLLRMTIGVLLALPAGGLATVASGVPTAQAAGECYRSGVVSDYATKNVAVGTVITSYVQYQIGYDCNLNPYDIYVRYFSATMTVSGGAAGRLHSTTLAEICTYDVNRYCAQDDWSQWSNNYCTGNCTVSRYAYPSVTIPYNYGNYLLVHWNGCDRLGGSWCESLHYFHQSYIYVEGSAFTG
jgi:hypothetical protein